MTRSMRILLHRSITASALTASLTLAQAPGPMPGGPPPPPPSIDLKVQYPNKVEGLFDITYLNVNGYRPLKLDLYHVPGGAPKPAIVYVHGGGFATGTQRGRFPAGGTVDEQLASVAARGYVVAAVTYRLSGEAKFPSQIEDVKAAIRWLRTNAAKYGIDPERVGIWGESVGGSTAALVGVSCGSPELEGKGNPGPSSCVKAAVDWYGVSDMAQLDAQAPKNATLIHNSPDSSQSQVLGCVLGFTCPADVVRRANPIAYIDPSDKNVSFLIIHGDADTAVAWQQSQILHDALQKQGISSKLEIVPNVNHNFAGITKEQSERVMTMTLDFLDAQLGPKRPAK